jgi:hypothetical protein
MLCQRRDEACSRGVGVRVAKAANTAGFDLYDDDRRAVPGQCPVGLGAVGRDRIGRNGELIDMRLASVTGGHAGGSGGRARVLGGPAFGPLIDRECVSGGGHRSRGSLPCRAVRVADHRRRLQSAFRWIRDTSRGIRTFRPRSFTVVSSTAGTAPNHERERPRGKSRKRHLQCHRYSAAVPRRVRTVPASVLWPCCGLDVARRRSR